MKVSFLSGPDALAASAVRMPSVSRDPIQVAGFVVSRIKGKGSTSVNTFVYLLTGSATGLTLNAFNGDIDKGSHNHFMPRHSAGQFSTTFCAFTRIPRPLAHTRLQPVFGGMYFYHSVCYFLPMSNATFGSSFSLRQSPFAVSSLITRGAARHPAPEKGRADAAAVGFWVEQVGLGFGGVRVACSLARFALLARLRWCCCSCACCAACPCWVLSSVC